jgi:hypothetical protein
MAYDQSDVELWGWGQDATFGATSVTHFIAGPKGKVGFVRDIIVDVTTSLVGTTTVPEVMVGISSGDFTYGRYRLGTSVSAGYGVGVHRAGQEYITGNPPRLASDFASHAVLDGGPLTSTGIAGGSYGTVVPKGRIPASGFVVTNVINGAGNVDRVFLAGASPAKDLVTGQSITVQGVSGVNAGVNGTQTISAIDTTNFQWIELSGTTFSGTYTTGGIVFVNVVVTCAAGAGGSTAGGGHVKVKMQWLGPETP